MFDTTKKLVLVALLWLGVAGSASAQMAPWVVPFSGIVTTTGGAPLSGTVTVTFALFEESNGGTPLWLEVQVVSADAEGQYVAYLGASTGGMPADVLGGGAPRWLSVKASNEPEQDRVQLLSVPYSLKAADAETLGGLPASAFLKADVIGSTAQSASGPATDADGGGALFASSGDGLTSVSNAGPVFASDISVQGSACVGFDCPSSPSFGFDTIRLQENNLRIHFEDTSASASFPTNDWRIRINDSSNGGDNYFAVEDSSGGRTPFRIEAGAKEHALYVEADGDVGVGTSNPVTTMHLVKGDTPTMRLEQDGSSGFTAQTWDVAGNETNFFIRDVTGGSKLPFRIKPGAPTDAVYVAANGDVGFGTDAPGTFGADAVISMKDGGPVRLGFRPDNNAAGAEEWAIVAGGNATSESLIFASTATPAGILTLDDGGAVTLGTAAADVTVPSLGSGADYFVCASAAGVLTESAGACSGSSINFKENVNPLPMGLETVMELRPVTFDWKPGYRANEPTQIGFVAQEVEDINPLLAKYREGELHGVMYAEMSALLVKAMQEQQTLIEQQTQRIDELEALMRQMLDAR